MGMELGLSVVVGCVGGSLLDDWLGTQPWLFFLGTLCGIIAGYRSLFRLVKKIREDSDSPDLDSQPPHYSN